MSLLIRSSLSLMSLFIAILFVGCEAPVAPPPARPGNMDSLAEQNNILILGAPSDLYLLATMSYQIGIHWKSNSLKYTSTVVERAVNDSVFINLNELVKPIEYCFDNNIQKSFYYRYRVYAIMDTTGKSIYSNILTVKYDSLKDIWRQE